MSCRHDATCGGCGLQHLAYEAQLARKQAWLLDCLPGAVARPWRERTLFLPVFTGTPWHVRQKVAFTFAPGRDGRGLVMGHYARGSQRLVPVEECPVHSARGNRIAFTLAEALRRAGVSAAGPALRGLVRHVLVRVTRDEREAVAMLVVTRNDPRLRAPVRALLASRDRPDGFFVNVHDEAGPFLVGRETIRIAGYPQIRERVGGVTYLVSPTAFFQTNVQAAETLQQQVLRYVSEAPGVSDTAGVRLLDAYAGSGLFTLPLAAAGAHVTAVEENRQAVRDADANVRLNRLPPSRVRLLASRMEEALPRLTRDRWDIAVVDPPRQGCAPAVLDAIFRTLVPRRVVYVSCNPAALGAELPRILESGYVVSDVKAVDMFPHTEHVEAVVCLDRR